METLKNPVIIAEADFNLLKTLVGTPSSGSKEMTLAYELNRATIVKDEDFPADAIRLNSNVKILDIGEQKTMEFSIVLPKLADIKQKKISITTPMGAALIGFRKGDEVEWEVPAGLKKFSIQDVVNS
jgi:regulator of nucleoside diphosphate kinase